MVTNERCENVTTNGTVTLESNATITISAASLTISDPIVGPYNLTIILTAAECDEVTVYPTFTLTSGGQLDLRGEEGDPGAPGTSTADATSGQAGGGGGRCLTIICQGDIVINGAIQTYGGAGGGGGMGGVDNTGSYNLSGNGGDGGAGGAGGNVTIAHGANTPADSVISFSSGDLVDAYGGAGGPGGKADGGSYVYSCADAGGVGGDSGSGGDGGDVYVIGLNIVLPTGGSTYAWMDASGGASGAAGHGYSGVHENSCTTPFLSVTGAQSGYVGSAGDGGVVWLQSTQVAGSNPTFTGNVGILTNGGGGGLGGPGGRGGRVSDPSCCCPGGWATPLDGGVGGDAGSIFLTSTRVGGGPYSMSLSARGGDGGVGGLGSVYWDSASDCTVGWDCLPMPGARGGDGGTGGNFTVAGAFSGMQSAYSLAWDGFGGSGGDGGDAECVEGNGGAGGDAGDPGSSSGVPGGLSPSGVSPADGSDGTVGMLCICP
ncbi:MAG: hypothetical protein R3B68_08130 [Phycisphaerales bacterium]